MSAIAEAVREELSPAQVRSIAQATARVNVWEGAIRSGKTIASLIAWLIHVATMASAPGEVVVFGRTRDSIARNVFGPLTDPRIFGPIAAHVRYTAGAPTATIFGQPVHIIGANDAKAEPKIRGLTAKSAYGDELTVLPVDFFRQVLGRLSVPGAKLFGSTNPDNPAHWLRRDYLLRPTANALRSWHFTLEDNHKLDPAFVAWAKSSYVGLWYKRFVLGEWVQAEGAIFEAFDPDRHVIDVLPPISSVLATGIDYGTRNPFAALMLCVATDGRLVLAREYRHDPRLSRVQLTDADYSQRYREWLGPHAPRFHAIDPSAASFKLQLHHDGVRGVVDAENAVTDGIRLVASLLATGRLLIHSSCAGLLAEVPGYAWDDEAAAKGEDKPIKANDHSCDAMRYAVATTEPLWRRTLPPSELELAAA